MTAGAAVRPEMEYRGEDPYVVWLRMLALGAATIMVTAVIDGLWNYVQLIGRVQGSPPRNVLQAIFGFVTLTLAAGNWMGGWLLSTASPLEEPRIDPPLWRLRRIALRAVVTAAFVLWSLRVIGLLGLANRPDLTDLRMLLVAKTVETLGYALVWVELYWLAKRLRLRKLRWRAAIMLILRAGVPATLWLPMIYNAVFFNGPTRVSWEFGNERSGLQVLVLGISAVVTLRFVIAFRNLASEAQLHSTAEMAHAGVSP